MRRRTESESGQALTEYLLLLSTVVFFFLAVSKGLAASGAADKIMRPVKQEFSAAYRYGHPRGKGFDDGGPENHPRAEAAGKNNFRMFLNPQLQ